jgi:alkanesulfonate monooxygenase SsuD/methylene tetrahydromethanopterin reductase-like flavin-dependent oxidoreductase (luciferase family)
VKVGLFLHTIDVGTGRTLSPTEIGDRAVHAEEQGFDSVWLADHFFGATRGGQRVFAHDPMLLLSAVAQRTRRIRFGPLVLCAPFRPAAQVAREAMTLQEMSQGRFVCGVGAGWYEPEFEAARIPFTALVGRFEAWLEDLRRAFDDGVVAPGSRPPVWVGAAGPRMLRITARLADGWNGVWGTEDAGWYEERVAALRAAVAAEGREAPLTLSAGLLVLPLEGAEAERALQRGREHARFARDEHAVTGSAEEIAGVLRRYGAAGADEVILALSTSPGLDFGPDLVERVAPVLELVR